ncbi:hypothetical protein JQK54_13940, partial [Enterococcus faecium]|nr:hypothetical protein [Enterococcus faecium]
ATDGLAPGAYQLVETQAPIGYELDATPIEFEIERSQTAVVELTKENRLTPGGVVLTKIDDQSGEILQELFLSYRTEKEKRYKPV